jgi:hypothetical protein
LILLTGLVMSTWFDLALNSYAAWHSVHVAATVATLVLTVLKIAIHGRWIISVARRSIWPPDQHTSRAPGSQPAPAPVDMGRRDFLKLMGLVGGAALIASISALSGGDDSASSGSAAAQSELSSAASSSAQSTSSLGSQSSSSQCFVRCDRRCSYPGHCRRYTDSDGNGRCDLGECA